MWQDKRQQSMEVMKWNDGQNTINTYTSSDLNFNDKDMRLTVLQNHHDNCCYGNFKQ